MNRLKGKRALITGGTTGIGLETAREFLSEGARVAITGKNPKTLETARQELGPDVLVIPSDASDAAAQKQVADAVQKAFGGLDVLFINAGIVDMRPIEQFDPDAFDRSFAINVKGPYFLIQALLPVFAKPANTTIYAASKAALISLVRTLSGELVARGVRVNAVSAGPIETPLYSKLGFSEEQLKAVATSIAGQVPLARFGKPSEIAHAIVFFASDESAYTVGSELLIDGGMSNI
jgi:NAD(P)-dependent dehydrogenase (short-subunit alcohol dehydrogenase family)